jgi:hypothetical protein
MLLGPGRTGRREGRVIAGGGGEERAIVADDNGARPARPDVKTEDRNGGDS